MRTCVIFSNGIGDGVMLLPALRWLQRKTGDELLLLSDIDFIRRWEHELNDIKCTALYFRRKNNRRYFDVQKAIAASQGCTSLISLSTWTSSSLIAFSQTFRESRGHFAHFTTHIPYDSQHHAIDNAFRLAGGNISEIPEFAGSLKLHTSDVEFARQFWGCLCDRDSRIIVHMETAASKQPDPEWLTRYFTCIADGIAAEPLVFISQSGVEYLDLTGRIQTVSVSDISFGAASALISECHFFLGVDSCFLHVADLFRKNGAALFVSTSAREYGWRLSKGGINIYANTKNCNESTTPEFAAFRTLAAMKIPNNSRRTYE